MSKKRNLIGLSSGIGGGKDLVGLIINYLTHHKYEDNEKERLESGLSIEEFTDINFTNVWENTFTIKKYADKLKDITCLIIGCTRKDLEDRTFKDKELGGVWDEYYVKFKYKYTPTNYFSQPITLKFDSKSDAEYFIGNGNDDYKEIKDCELIIKSLAPRDFQVIIGTDCGRNMINKNIWVNALFADYKGHTPKVHSGSMMDENCYNHSSCYNCKLPFFGYKRQPICLKCVNENAPFYPSWIISDVRFPDNEGKAITERNGFVIGIKRKFSLRYPEYDYLENVSSPYEIPKKLKEINKELYNKLTGESEVSMGDLSWCDYIIENDGTIDELALKVKDILIIEELL